jgi:hydrogenase expression/formation protein HypC
MCLAVPGKLIRWLRADFPFMEAEVDFMGVRRVCNLACVPEALPGEYVIVHAGVAISRVDETAALRSLADLGSLGELESEEAEG